MDRVKMGVSMNRIYEVYANGVYAARLGEKPEECTPGCNF
jgi:hypothetical protein